MEPTNPALNDLAVRNDQIYASVTEQFGYNRSLSAVDLQPSSLRGIRKIVEVIVSFVRRETDVIDKYFVRVDVTEPFPFLVSKLTPYYAHQVCVVQERLTMRLPGFTASVSLSQSTTHYEASPLITRAFVAKATSDTVRAALSSFGSACNCNPPPGGCCHGDSQGDPCVCCRIGNHVRCIYI